MLHMSDMTPALPFLSLAPHPILCLVVCFLLGPGFWYAPVLESQCFLQLGLSFRVAPNFTSQLMQLHRAYTQHGKVFGGACVWWKGPLLTCGEGSVLQVCI